ncbi:MAG: hypothetical protein ACK5Y2_08025 [Bdellovibrionales bacterium]
MKLLAFLSLVLVLESAQAKSFLLGHNIGMTTETAEAGTATLGSYAALYAPTDQWLVGTSTWMLYGYNSYNLVTRYRFDLEEKFFDEVAGQLAYLKSGEFGENYYRQELAIAWLTGKISVNPYYQLYLTFNYMYFWNETIPFSLRREPFNDDKYQISLSSLHVLKFTDDWSMLLEFGILGLRARYPQTHSGFSVAYQQPRYLIQLGFTVSSTPYNLERLFETSSAARPRGDYYDSSVHPEVQLQWYF